MAEALASFLVELLATAAIEKIEQHVKLAVDAKNEVGKLQNTFKTIQRVLNDAEKRQFNDESVKDWLDQFQEVAYDMEDVLDEWRTEILRLRIEPDENDGKYNKQMIMMVKEKVSSYLCSPFSTCFKKTALYYDIGSRIKEIRERLDSICGEQTKFKFTESSKTTSTSALYYGISSSNSKRMTSSIVDVSTILGRDSDKNNLTNRLLDDEGNKSSNETWVVDPRIISIIGMGGLGKTTLTQLIINDDKVKTKFKDNILWVCVSDPFDRAGIAKAIIREATKTSTNTTDWNPLHNELIDAVQGKRFLLVLDDVWTDDEDNLKPFKDLLRHGDHASRIIITTRKETVGKAMNSSQYHLGILSDNDCWLLLISKAFEGRNVEEDKALKEISVKIANKCNGLPLAASILGGLMKKKQNERHWNLILKNEIWDQKFVEDKLFKPLLMSYNDLSSPLKRCFAYCAIFPKDHQIDKHELIKMWMAQGFLNSSTDTESLGQMYFDCLAEWSFFQDLKHEDDRYGVGDVRNIVSCRMHDIVHDFAIFLTKDNLDIKHNRDNNTSLTLEVKNLRSLLISPSSEHYSLINDSLRRPTNIFHHLRCLRVLKLQYMDIEHLPSEIKELIHLRYLNLSYNTSLTKLPDSICSLFNLQTLRLNWCKKLDKLPRGMKKMINLKNLYIRDTAASFALPEEIGKLTSLQTLDMVNINGAGGGGCKLSVLKDLNFLRGQLIIMGLRSVKTVNEASQAELIKKKGLYNLELDFNHDNNIDESTVEIMESVLGVLQPHPNLIKLTITSYAGRTTPANWFASLTSLSSLTLYHCFNITELPVLGLLPSLKLLTLCKLNNIKHIGFEIDRCDSGTSFDPPVFPNLKHLKEINISECPKLKTLRSLSRLQSLEVLKLEMLNNLEEFKSSGEDDDSVLINMLSLKSLVIRDCPNLKSSLQQLNLPKLNQLDILDCRSLSDQLPTSVSNLTSLRISYASHSLPPKGLGGLKKLQHLHFYNCSFLTGIPDDVRHLTALQTLVINDCDWPHPDYIEQDEEAWSIMSHIPEIIIFSRCGMYRSISTLTPTGTRQQTTPEHPFWTGLNVV